MEIDIIILFFVVFFANLSALALTLGLTLKDFGRKIDIVFSNHLPSLIDHAGDRVGKKIYGHLHSLMMNNAKTEKIDQRKEEKQQLDGLAGIIGPELATAVGFLPDGIRSSIIQGAIEHPEIAKMIVDQVKNQKSNIGDKAYNLTDFTKL